MTTIFGADLRQRRTVWLEGSTAPETDPGAPQGPIDLPPGVYELRSDGPVAVAWSGAPGLNDYPIDLEVPAQIVSVGGSLFAAAIGGGPRYLHVTPIVDVESAMVSSSRVRNPQILGQPELGEPPPFGMPRR